MKKAERLKHRTHRRSFASFQKFRILACHPGNLSSYQAPNHQILSSRVEAGESESNPRRKNTPQQNPKKNKKRQVVAQLGSRTTGARHLRATGHRTRGRTKATAPLVLRGRPPSETVVAWGPGGRGGTGRKPSEKLGNLRSRARRTNVPPALWAPGGRGNLRSLRPGEESKRAPGVLLQSDGASLSWLGCPPGRISFFRFGVRGPRTNLYLCRWIVQINCIQTQGTEATEQT